MISWNCTIRLVNGYPVMYYYTPDDRLEVFGLGDNLPRDFEKFTLCEDKVKGQVIIDHYRENKLDDKRVTFKQCKTIRKGENV